MLRESNFRWCILEPAYMNWRASLSQNARACLNRPLSSADAYISEGRWIPYSHAISSTHSTMLNSSPVTAANAGDHRRRPIKGIHVCIKSFLVAAPMPASGGVPICMPRLSYESRLYTAIVLKLLQKNSPPQRAQKQPL